MINKFTVTVIGLFLAVFALAYMTSQKMRIQPEAPLQELGSLKKNAEQVNNPVQPIADSFRSQLQSTPPEKYPVKLSSEPALVNKEPKSSPALSPEQLAELKRRAKEKRSELNALIAEYDQHLSDPERRSALQSKMDDLFKEYNKLVLPLAVAEMQQPK